MIPTSIFRIWFLGLFSWILLGAEIYAGHKWYQRAWSYDFDLQRSYFDPHIGYDHETLLLFIATALLLWVLAGGLVVRGILGTFLKAQSSGGRAAQPKLLQRRGDGVPSELRVECYGREDAPPIILTHGWGANNAEWSWTESDGSRWTAFFFKWDAGPASSRFWLDCTVRRIACLRQVMNFRKEKNIMVRAGDLSLPFRAMDFEHHGKEVYVFYCFWQGGLRSGEQLRVRDHWERPPRRTGVGLSWGTKSRSADPGDRNLRIFHFST